MSTCLVTYDRAVFGGRITGGTNIRKISGFQPLLGWGWSAEENSDQTELWECQAPRGS